jgi:hypothetical protein
VANALIAFGNAVDKGLLSGGSWLSSLPLSNLYNRVIHKLARSTDASLASTQLLVDLQKALPLRTLAIVNHNLSLSGKYRIRASNDGNFITSLIDSGWRDAWPSLYASLSLDWQADNWWSGRYTEADRAGYIWTTIFSATVTTAARYWLFEFDDQANVAGYIQLGRIFIGEAWQPKVNIALGATLGWNDETQITSSLSGTEYFDKRRPYRVSTFETNFMDQDDALGKALDIKRRLGLSGEAVFQFDPDDTTQSLRRQFYGRLRELTPIEYPYPTINNTAWEIKETI